MFFTVTPVQGLCCLRGLKLWPPRAAFATLGAPESAGKHELTLGRPPALPARGESMAKVKGESKEKAHPGAAAVVP
jgi:hypothetical protein